MRHKKTLLFLCGLALVGGAGFAVSSIPIEDGAVSNGQILYKPSRPAQSDVLERFALQRDPWLVYGSPAPQKQPTVPSSLIPKAVVAEAKAAPSLTVSSAGSPKPKEDPIGAILHKVAYSSPAPTSSSEPVLVIQQPIKLRQADVVDGGTLRDEHITVQLKGIRPLPLAATCKTNEGASWPCGRHARRALARFVQNKSVDCYEGEQQGSGEILAHCIAGPHDIATWLVQNGWARPDGTRNARLADLVSHARNEERGQWRTRMVTLKGAETGRLISSFKELYEYQRSALPLVMDGSPRIIWRRRSEPQLKTPPVPEPRS